MSIRNAGNFWPRPPGFFAGNAERPQPAAAGDPSFMNNVPDPALSGKDLPTFKFALEKSAGKVIGRFGKEATVEQLPISKGIAGFRCGSSPARCASCTGTHCGGWAFVIDGRVRTRLIDPQGLAETNDFDPGDVWYFPRGHGQCCNAWAQNHAFHPDLRQRLLFQFGTSASPTGSDIRQSAARESLACPRRRSTAFPKGRGVFARGKPLPLEPGPPLQGWKLPPETHKYRLLAQPPHATYQAAESGG